MSVNADYSMKSERKLLQVESNVNTDYSIRGATPLSCYLATFSARFSSFFFQIGHYSTASSLQVKARWGVATFSSISATLLAFQACCLFICEFHSSSQKNLEQSWLPVFWRKDWHSSVQWILTGNFCNRACQHWAMSVLINPCVLTGNDCSLEQWPRKWLQWDMLFSFQCMQTEVTAHSNVNIQADGKKKTKH